MSAEGDAFIERMSRSARLATPEGGGADLTKIAIRPDQPGWANKIPPPEPDYVPPAVISINGREIPARKAPEFAFDLPADVTDPLDDPPVTGVIISYGPTPKSYIVSVERGVAVAVSVRVSQEAIRNILPVLRELTCVRDLTAGGLDEPAKVGAAAAESARPSESAEWGRADREETAPTERAAPAGGSRRGRSRSRTYPAG